MNLNNFYTNKKFAFTLAEVVVVMAILGVMMAAFAPVVTKKTLTAGQTKKTFDIMQDHLGIHFGTTSDSKSVVVGDNKILTGTNFDPKLLMISTTFTDGAVANTITPAIGFGYKKDSTTNTAYNGQLTMIKDPADATDFGRIVLGGVINKNYTTTNLKKNTTAIGMGACEGNTGENVVCLGTLSGTLNNATSNRIYIGKRDVSYGSGNIYFGNTALSSLITQTMSDIRLKNVGKEFKGGLDEINQLKFYNYTYKRDAEKTPRVGVMAQDLQKVFPNAVNKNDEGYLYIRKDDMFYASLNAIKELFTKITDNSAKIQALEERNAMLEQQNKELQQLYIELSNRVDNLDKKSTKKKLTKAPEKPAAEEVEAVTPDEK